MSDTVVTLAAPRKSPPKTVGELLAREDETTHRLTAVATKFLPAERAMRLAIMAVRRTPKLAACDPTSFMGALMGATGLGLEPNTPKQHAFLIPYEQRKPRRDQNNQIMKDSKGSWLWDSYFECQLQVGYKGFVALFYRTQLVTEVTAEAIREGDLFQHRKGTETYLRYEKNLGQRGDLLGSFCFTRLKDGQAFTVLPTEEIYKLRSRSQTYTSLVRKVDEAEAELAQSNSTKNQRDLAKAQRTLAETPWVMWEDEMAAKSSIRRHAKQQDLGTEANSISIAADLDSLGDAGTIDMRAMADPDFAKTVMQGDEPLEPGQEEGEAEHDPDTGEVREQTETTTKSPAEAQPERSDTNGRGGPPAGDAPKAERDKPAAKKRSQKDLF